MQAQVGAAPTGALIGVQAVVINPRSHKVYAIDQRGAAVVVVDDTTGARHAVKVGDAPEAIAINVATNRVYVANRASGTVSVIDGATDAVVATVKVGARPFALAADATTNRVYVSNTFNDAMTIIEGATNETSTMKVGGADVMLVEAKGGSVYLTGWEDSNLRVLHEDARSFTRMKTGNHNWGLAQNARTGDLWAPLAGGSAVVMLDGTSGERTEIPVGAMPCAVAVNAVTNKAYVVNYGDQTLSVVDGASRKVVATVKVGAHPQAVAVDSQRNRVYVANVHGDSVTVVDGSTNKVAGTRPAGRHPYALAVSEPSGTVYAADLGDPAADNSQEPLTVLTAGK